MSRGVKIAALTGLFLAVLGLAYYLRSVFLPFLVALLLAYVLNPLLQREYGPVLAAVKETRTPEPGP